METKNLRESAKVKIQITKNELRQLVFWASCGVANAKGGSYQDTIIETLNELKQKYGLQTIFGKVEFKKSRIK